MNDLRDLGARGEQARRLLDDPLLQEAFAQLGRDCQAEWLASAPNDTAGRERLYHLAQLTQRLQALLRAALADGELAKLKLDQIRSGAAPLP